MKMNVLNKCIDLGFHKMRWNKEYKTLKSSNLAAKFRESPELWHEYHEISRANELTFPEDEIPRNRIAAELNKIKSRRAKLVVDLGCGEGMLASQFKTDKRFEFINYDHIAAPADPNVKIEIADISAVPLDDESAEYVVLCLAMWGSNCESYLDEAYRILESHGRLLIIEATKRWTNDDDSSRLATLLEKKGFIIRESSIEKFSLFQCEKP